MARTTEQVFQDHMDALARGDPSALMADYDDDSVLMTMDAILVGREAILGFFAASQTATPNARMESARCAGARRARAVCLEDGVRWRIDPERGGYLCHPRRSHPRADGLVLGGAQLDDAREGTTMMW